MYRLHNVEESHKVSLNTVAEDFSTNIANFQNFIELYISTFYNGRTITMI